MNFSKTPSYRSRGPFEGVFGYSSCEFNRSLQYVALCDTIHAARQIQYCPHVQHQGSSKWTRHRRIQCFQSWSLRPHTFPGLFLQLYNYRQKKFASHFCTSEESLQQLSPTFVRLSFFTFYMHLLMCCQSGPQSKLNHLPLFLNTLKLLCAALIAGNHFFAFLFIFRNWNRNINNSQSKCLPVFCLPHLFIIPLLECWNICE